MVKEITYYLPRQPKQKKIAVVLIIDGDMISRGIAICSNKDQFNKKRGRMIALGRAVKAIITEESGPKNPITRQLTEPALDNLSSFMPAFTDFETELIDNFF